MNKKLIITTLLLVYFSTAFSQVKDTIFYNQYWNESAKKYAHFYRPLPLETKGDLFIIKDYYINGNLQMKAFSKSKSGKPFDGKVVWFFENGTKMSEKEYDNGNIGKGKSYFKDGTLMTSSEFTDGKCSDGTFYNSQKSEFKTVTYKEGKRISNNAYYEKTKTIAVKKLYNRFKEESNFIFFSEKGDTLFVGNDSYRNVKYNGIIKVCYSLSEDKNIKEVAFLIHQKVVNEEIKQIVKDKKGTIVAEGIYKDNKSFNGQFIERKTILNYKNGVKDGEVVFFDDNYNEVSKGVYKDGKEFSGDFFQSYSKEIRTYNNGKVIAKQTVDKFTGKKYRCTFDNYKAIDGDFFDYSSLKSYKSGTLIKQINYNASSGKIKEIVYYNPEKEYQVEKRVFFENNKEYIVTYKEGRAFNGKELNSYGFITHKEGEVTGPFLIKDNKVTVSGNYKNYRKEGEVKHVLKNNNIYTCFYKDGKPINGTAFEFYGLTSYKNGKKEGCGYKTFNNNSYPYDSLQICYREDLPVGNTKYYKKGTLITTGKYKKGKPFEGVFYKQKNKKVYKSGQIIEQQFSFLTKYTTQQFLNTNKQITKELVKDYRSDSIVYTTIYKKGLPFNGTQVKYDTLNRLYIETSYVNGKKEGDQFFYENFYSPFVKKYHYKNNFKEGIALFNTSLSDSTYQGFFKKDKAFNGVFVSSNGVSKSKIKLNKGDTISVSYYSLYGKSKTTSIQYKNGKPFEGILLRKVKEKKYEEAYQYSKGKLIVSYSRPSRFVNDGEPNYYRSKTYYKALQDSTVIGKPNSDNKRTSYFVVNYTSEAKETGTVTYFENQVLIGEGSFKNNELTSFKYKGELRYLEHTLLVKLTEDVLEYKILQGEYGAEFSSYRKSIESPKNKYFNAIIKAEENIESDVKLFIDDKLLSVVTVKNGKPNNGVLFDLKSDNNYSVFVYKNGKRTERINDLSKEELMHRMEEFKMSL